MKTSVLRSGLTTGTCAAAAAKAAALAWSGQRVEWVEVILPGGKSAVVPVEACTVFLEGGKAVVIKDAGDDPDITDGARIEVTVSVRSAGDIWIRAGRGVGTVTKPGLAVPVGEPAVNPVPRRMIEEAVREALPVGMGAEVTIEIPGGEALAKKTLNPALGIVGGISVIGTTGIVRPMSEDAFKEALAVQISVVRAAGYDTLILVPGRIGQDIAVGRFGLPAEQVVQMSNFVGVMLDKAVEAGVRQVLLLGHPGKVAKVAAGVFHTHNRVADARLETLAAYAAVLGASRETVAGILACTTTEAAMPIIADSGLEGIYRLLAERASARAGQRVFGGLTVGTVIVSLQGELLGLDETARRIGGELGWDIR